VTDSCTSCVCGHVFECSKQIGGKRFSGELNYLIYIHEPEVFLRRRHFRFLQE